MAQSDAALSIGYLADHPRALTAVVQWLHLRWMRHYGYGRPAARVEVKSRLNRHTLPITWVAHAGGRVVGTISISANTRPDSEGAPWCLSGLYVDRTWRSRGVGRLLCGAAVAKARELDLTTLTLYTRDRASYFAQQGWQTCGSVMLALSGRPVAVTAMTLVLPRHRHAPGSASPDED